MQYKGRVLKITERSGKGRNGKPYTLFGLVLDTPEGEKMIGCGFDKPKADVGSMIEVSAENNQRGYLEADVSSIKVLRDEQPANTPAPANTSAALDHRQRSIVTQTSYKIAADAVDTMLAQGLVKLPAAKSATNDSFEAYLAVLDKTAQHVFNQCMTGLTVEENEETSEEDTEDEGDYDPFG